MPDFKKVKEIFLAALERADAREREAYLARACEGDAEMSRRVDALLRRHEQAGEFLHAPEFPETLLSAASPGPAREDAAGACIGPYRLLQQIGEGGMGAVWMAEQHSPVRRTVAVKVIRAGLDGGRMAARFEAERQALALMSHPNIAQILDSGTTEDGRPYFVMELIKGTPITHHCDEHRLTLRQRLELFIPVCEAVQHAHHKGVIHRDIKPSNVLVATPDGRPSVKVIDFGVAKAAGQRLTERTLITEAGAVIGTLRYMSPEQATLDNQDIDTRSDIYSLGVLLYELLTGSTPLTARRREQGPVLEALRAIREEEPPPPSARIHDSADTISARRQTDPVTLRTLLRGDLDWIVMKALEKDRGRRYETANGLALDIARFLNHEPVLAAPPGMAYRLRKFILRNKARVIAGCLLLLALLIGLAGTTFGLIRAEQARAEEARQRGVAEENGAKALAQSLRAERARDRTRRALDDMTSAVTGDSLTSQKEISDEQKRFLTEVLTYYRELASEDVDDEPSRARTAAAAYRVGLIEYRLGRKAEAAAATRLACDGLATLAAEAPAEKRYRQQLANGHNNLAILLRDLERRDEAAERHRKALAIQERLAADFPGVPEYRLEQANSHNNLGNLLLEAGKRPEAEEHLRKALAIHERLPSTPVTRFARATAHVTLGNLLRQGGKRTQAEERYREALGIQGSVAEEYPTVPEYRFELAATHDFLGILFMEVGKKPEAEEQIRMALAIQEQLVAEYPSVPAYRLHLAGTHNNLGALMLGMGERPEAEKQLGRALAIRAKLAADFPAVPVYRLHLAGTHANLGALLKEAGKRRGAEDQYRNALAIQRDLAADFPAVPDYRLQLAGIHNNLGNLLSELGRRAQAEEQYRKALDIREKLAGDSPAVPRYQVELGGSYCNLGNLVSEGGRPGDSLGWYEKAIRTLKAAYEQDGRVEAAGLFLRNSHIGRARAYDRLKKHAEAVKDWERAIELTPEAGRLPWRACRATSRINAGQVAEAVAEVAELTKSSGWDAGQWYDFARVYAAAVGKGGDRKQEYAGRAMLLLQRAVKAGFRDAAHAAKDTALDPLREQDGFKELLAELSKKAAAGPENR